MSEVLLVVAIKKDIPLIHKMQIESFKELYERYQDRSNPGLESLEKVKNRFNKKDTTYFLIKYNGVTTGAIRLNRKAVDRGRISPIFILPEYENNKIGQKAIITLENLYPKVKVWELSTVFQESKLCYFYEKLGYRSFGKIKNIRKGLDFITFRKICNQSYL